VLRALQGATLNFDRPLDVLRGEFGRLIGGRLNGEITIHSPSSQPGRDDAIDLVTRNVQLDAEKIWTPHDVRFRYGGNTGSGRGLTIYIARATKPDAKESGLGVGALRVLELLHLDTLQLQMNDSGLFGRAGSRPALRPRQPQPGGQPPPAAESAPGAEPSRSTPVIVKCRGPFRFDFEQQLITLEDHVDLSRHNLNGKIDQLLCQLLEVHFARTTTDAESSTERPTGNSSFSRLEPAKVIASGYPVIIRANSVGIETGAERIEYDCILRRVWLKDRQRVMFKDRQREVEARELRYELGEKGRLGVLAAAGPGVVRGVVGEAAQAWEVTWQDQVDLHRVDGIPVLSFQSRVEIELTRTGTFSADALHLYLKEIPDPADAEKLRVELDRLHALGNVVITSPKLAGEVREARLWFRNPAQDTSEASASPNRQGPSTGSPMSAFDAHPLFASGSPTDSQRAPRKFHVRADVIEALVVTGKDPVADRLVLRGDIELREVTEGELQPLAIHGDLLELLDGATPRPRGALAGKPAEVSVRGLDSRGELFHLFPADNHLQIIGPGDMTLSPRLAQDQPPPRQRPARIAWKHQMQFDGQHALFEQDVCVNTDQPTRDGQARCMALGDTVRVQLTRRVDFQKPNVDGPTELADVAFDGWACLEVELFDTNGARKLFEQMQVRDLRVNHVTGDIQGHGPGWLRGIHRGQDISGPEVERSALPISTSGLNFLRVDFERNLAGNLHQRRVEFLQGTKTLYGPVESWDAGLDQLPESQWPDQTVVLTCQRLSVAQPGSNRSGEQIELEATGNAYVEGNSFSATGNRISYSRIKDQLILEGDGRNRATLAYRKINGAPPSHINAGSIMFWPGSRQYKVLDLGPSEVNVSQLGREKR
jgi:hypothetical protein